ncbi:hypothetical protein ONZ43_g1796 [Nemania bipapillata]|uniref:Uncharacterized protein n=1 Tax=Nemania bipapillata TaxID=110536 RepID=A0ACC2J377_9PEZI|nr:hypothetical protein ONZ43_g1796 [Nemania bipapillata]
MIARSAHVGAVCLRCRLQLRQFTPARYISTSDAPGTPPSAPPSVPLNDPPSAHRPHDRADGEDAIQDAATPGENPELRPGRLLKEAVASLGTDVLGKPAYAIVMRDGGKVKKRKLPKASVDEEPGSSGNIAESIEALIDSQRESPAQDEVRSNIEGLRPTTDTVLLEKDFRKLQRLLTRGFLSTQLQDYLESFEKPEVGEATTSRNFSWIRSVTHWEPLPTDSAAVDNSNIKLRGYVPDKTPAKGKLAIRIMRECWGLSIAEVLQTQLGETWIKMDNSEFVLLMRGTQRFMNTLGDVWLEPGETIEAFRNQKMLRLVTTQQKVDTLIRDLHKTLRSIVTKTFPIFIASSETPNDATLEELGRITNTYLHVTWIELKSRAAKGFAHLEDMAHIVFRLLLTAVGPRQATSTLLSPTVSGAHPGRLIVDTMSKSKLGWKDRLSQWARYTQPVTPKDSAVDTVLPLTQFKLPFEPSKPTENLNENLEFFPDTPFPPYPVKWSNVSRTSTVAHFGQVLHPYDPLNPTPSLPSLLANTNKPIFVPTSPHPLYLTKFDTDNSNTNLPLVTTKSTLVLHFWPSPSSNPVEKLLSSKKSKAKSKAPSAHAGDTPPAPLLELRLTTSDNEVKGVESLRAISRTHHTDVMLPSSLVDVRFTQTQHEMLQAKDHETLTGWQPLADFLGASRLDLENGKLEVPPRQRFFVPRRLFTKIPSPFQPSSLFTARGYQARAANEEQYEQQQEEEETQYSEDGDLVSISYEFVGLESHLSATVPYEGHQLTYTSIEAGQGGGRRAEITLEPIEYPHSTNSSAEVANRRNQQEDFLACCSKLVADRSLWRGIDNYKPRA